MRIGLYNRHLATLGGGERHSLAVATALAERHDVQVISHSADAWLAAARRLKLNLERVTLRVVAPRFAADLAPLTAEYDCFINASNLDFIPPAAPYNILLVYFPLAPVTGWTAPLRRQIAATMRRWLEVTPESLPDDPAGGTRISRWLAVHLPEWDARLRNPQPPDIRAVAAQYQLRWANSRFTQRWIDRYWQLPSAVLYPPVAVEELAPGTKTTQILSVGRFFAGQHNKRHLVLVEAFRTLVDGGLTGWELHLAGGLTPGTAHAAYLDQVRAAAAAYPIVIHTDVPFDELRSLYARSAIYWHAAGFGYDEETAPIRFEHFGITTVEAMAAGCVPVVYAAGGQRELVADGVTGYGWRTPAELCARTEQLIADPALRGRLADGAVLSSRRFDWAHFRQRLAETLAEAASPVSI